MSLFDLRARRSPKLTIAAAITAGVLLLGGAIGVGLRWPGSWFGFGPDDETDFDYSALARALERLSDEYVGSFSGAGSFSKSAPAGRTRLGRAKPAPLNITHPFTNDDFERAYDVTSLPFRARTDTTGAKRQAGEPTDCFPTGGTAWYRYKAPADVALFSDTFGTSETTALGVYSGNSRRALTLIGCDTNVLGNAQVGFRATAGTTYYFQVTGVKGGPTVFELAAVGSTTIESLSPTGGLADANSYDNPDISADGRYVAFVSKARNLAPETPDCGRPTANGCESLYLRDRLTGATTRLASHDSPYRPDQPDTVLFAASLSADGRYVGFSTYPDAGFAGYRGGPSDSEFFAYNAYLYDRITGHVELVSRNSNGEAARGDPATYESVFHGSYATSISTDGRYVTFNSDAANLGGPVEPGGKNVYRRDRVTGITRIVSTDESGEPLRGNSCAGTGRNISGDGRFVVFINHPSPGASRVNQVNYPQDEVVRLWDANTGRSRLVAKNSYCPSISLDGSRVGLVSLDPLVSDDTNGTPDVYVYEVATGNFKRVSVTSAGQQTHDPNYTGREHGFLRRAVNLSADGRFAVFDSAAPDLAPSAVGSTRHLPNTTRVFLHDILTGATVLVSVSSTGEPLPGDSNMPYISPDGRSIAFMNVGPSGLQNVMVHELSIFR